MPPYLRVNNPKIKIDAIKIKYTILIDFLFFSNLKCGIRTDLDILNNTNKTIQQQVTQITYTTSWLVTQKKLKSGTIVVKKNNWVNCWEGFPCPLGIKISRNTNKIFDRIKYLQFGNHTKLEYE